MRFILSPAQPTSYKRANSRSCDKCSLRLAASDSAPMVHREKRKEKKKERKGKVGKREKEKKRKKNFN
jgi:hypothetical protein